MIKYESLKWFDIDKPPITTPSLLPNDRGVSATIRPWALPSKYIPPSLDIRHLNHPVHTNRHLPRALQVALPARALSVNHDHPVDTRSRPLLGLLLRLPPDPGAPRRAAGRAGPPRLCEADGP